MKGFGNMYKLYFDVIDKYYERILELSYSEKIKRYRKIFFARDFDKYYNGNIFGNENIVSEYKEILLMIITT